MISLNTENNKKYMWKLHNFFVTFWFLEIAHLWMARILVSDLFCISIYIFAWFHGGILSNSLLSINICKKNIKQAKSVHE